MSPNHSSRWLPNAPAALVQAFTSKKAAVNSAVLSPKGAGQLFSVGRRDNDYISLAGFFRRKGASEEEIAKLLQGIDSVIPQPHGEGTLGFPVFPVNPGNKHPLIKGWPQRATLDQDQAIHWWENAPWAMVGACTGDVSGYFGVDIDTKDGVDADTKMKRLEAVYLEAKIH